MLYPWKGHQILLLLVLLLCKSAKYWPIYSNLSYPLPLNFSQSGFNKCWFMTLCTNFTMSNLHFWLLHIILHGRQPYRHCFVRLTYLNSAQNSTWEAIFKPFGLKKEKVDKSDLALRLIGLNSASPFSVGSLTTVVLISRLQY